MPRNKNNPEPPQAMTWGKASPLLVVAAVFDSMRIFFEFFWFFGPALASVACTTGATSILGVGIGGMVGKVAGGLCTGAAAAVGTVASPLMTMFGAVMAMAVGFGGWLIIGGWLWWTNARIFKENALWFVGSLAISEIPFVGALPAITAAVWRMYSVQIKKEKAALEKWEADQAAQQLKERQQQAAQLMQMQAAQMREQEAANEARYAEAANDEIPDEKREAA